MSVHDLIVSKSRKVESNRKISNISKECASWLRDRSSLAHNCLPNRYGDIDLSRRRDLACLKLQLG
jgi:hypothetical protein